tara:strand:- start:68 stop:565 length:498 start_codon:yes stop_codon:yes gene_type:complete
MRIRPIFLSFIFWICFLKAQSFDDTSSFIKEYQISSEKYISGPEGRVFMKVNFWVTGGTTGTVQVQEGIDFASLMSKVVGPSQFANLKKIRLYRETPDENGQMVYFVDLTSFLKNGDRSNFPQIKPNDTIVVKKTLTGVLVEDLGTFQTLVSFITFILQVYTVLS